MSYMITNDGLSKMQSELEQLNEQRSELTVRIRDARAYGDIDVNENHEYLMAKEDRDHLDARIAVLKEKISGAIVVDIDSLMKDKVYFGSTVKLVNADTDEETVFQIVSDEEVEASAGKISNVSPIARALLGKEVGDEITVKAPRGSIDYEVLAIL